MSRLALAALLVASVCATAPIAAAQEAPADLAGFSAACAGAQQFLLGDVPPGVDPASILTPLCGCLATSFKDLPQKDVDILAADLRGEGSEEAHAAHGAYDQVEENARVGLTACFASPEVRAAMPEVPASATEPAAPADPAAAPAEPAPAPAQ